MTKESKFGSDLPRSQWIQKYIRRTHFLRSDFDEKPKMAGSEVYFIFAVIFVFILLLAVKL